MALVKVRCKKCNEQSSIDISDWSKEKVEKWLNKDTGGFECFGHHVEFGKRSDYWVLDWDSIEEGTAPTEEEFLEKLRGDYNEVYDTKTLQDKYEVQGFMYGSCNATSKETGESAIFNFTTSPKGARYYYRGQK